MWKMVPTPFTLQEVCLVVLNVASMALLWFDCMLIESFPIYRLIWDQNDGMMEFNDL